ncbi:MAG: hypothetical protein ACYDE0_01290 [Acidiferrobacterales bacterium]
MNCVGALAFGIGLLAAFPARAVPTAADAGMGGERRISATP